MQAGRGHQGVGGAGLTPSGLARRAHGDVADVDGAGCSTHGTRADLAGEHYQPVIDAIGRLLSACLDAGRVRPDVDADELSASAGGTTGTPEGRKAPDACSRSCWTVSVC